MQLFLPFVALAAAVMQGNTPTPALKLDNIRLLVTRFDEAFVFYRDVVGLRPTSGKPGENYASFVFPGGAQIALFKRELMAEALGTGARPATRLEQDTAALILSVDDVDALYARLKAKGVEFVGPPTNRDVWGIRAAHFRDPDGNLIEIFGPLKK
jgi:catechol 2,3-dioxygenase-like lactoylglutathione lyase family enzyme